MRILNPFRPYPAKNNRKGEAFISYLIIAHVKFKGNNISLICQWYWTKCLPLFLRFLSKLQGMLTLSSQLFEFHVNFAQFFQPSAFFGDAGAGSVPVLEIRENPL